MNWLGKVFVVLIFIMSLMFMTLSMAVYATHKNWKTVADGLNTQLQAAEAEKAALTTAHNHRVEELTSEKDSAREQVAKLSSEQQGLEDRNVAMQAELEGLRQTQREQVAAVASTQGLNQSLTSEVTDLRQRVRNEQQARDTAFAATLEATENAHQMRNELDTAVETNRQLLKDVAGKTYIMREELGVNPNRDPGSVVPTVNGLVSEVRRTGGAQFVEVTIGSDDGLSEGNTLEVSRGARYLGRIEIVETSPDKSVGRVDRRFQQGQIQEGDRVATRIKL